MNANKNRLFLLILAGLNIFFSCYEQEKIVIEDVSLNSTRDGIYPGQHSSFPVKVQVKVHIKNNMIDSIEILKHRNGKGEKAEKITKSVIEKQSLKVDAISGATYSSKVILKAIEKAVKKSISSN